ncbi:MAG TPA: hypothetical protein VGO90_09570 [Chthoniobacteraceae bacterium]|jgi:glyoxylase-like metal-dependent hydrolase (beta-lactamase superfamily II)|nr:hypothetical protein [Chthoniobacteraceae bacterium]
MIASECQRVREDLYFWQAYEPAVKSDLSCCARRFGSRLIFIDPIPLKEQALNEVTVGAEPSVIILTNGNHARAAAELRNRFSIPIHAHSGAVAELGLTVDWLLGESAEASDLFDVVELPGGGPGEIALHADGVMHVGDALIHLESTGLAVLPAKYCSDVRLLRRSLGKLLRFDFEVLTFAHGLPLVSDARRRLESLLA